MLERLASACGAHAMAARRGASALGAAAALTLQRGRAAAQRTWPRIREHVKATATFAAIAAFGALSFDYLITGGPQWNPAAPVLDIITPAAAAERAPVSVPMQRIAFEPEVEFTPIVAEEFALTGPVEELLGGPDTVFVASAAEEPALLRVSFAAIDKPETSVHLGAAADADKQKTAP